jgi:hypothetical protein
MRPRKIFFLQSLRHHIFSSGHSTIPMLVVAVLALRCAPTPVLAPVSLSVAQNHGWPNDPSGSTVMSDYALGSMATPTDGCCNVQGWTTFCANCFTSTDETAPISPPTVGTWGYTANTDWGGISPGNVFYNFSNTKKDQIYMAYYWKASSNWIGHPSNINKLSFAMADGTNIIPVMYGIVSPYQLEVGVQVDSSISNEHIDGCRIPGTCNFFANTGSNELVPGNWYLLEFYFKQSTCTTCRNGIVRAWINGLKTHEFTNVNMGSQPFHQAELNPTYGGGSGVPRNVDMFFWYDHVRLTTGGTPGGETPPLPPPSSPN